MAPLSLLTAFLLPFLLFLQNISCTKPLCHNYEKSALLQFKQSFSIDLSAPSDPSFHSKVSSWNDNDCCLWDGVECHEVSGHVIGLDLSSSFLYGSFSSNSTLFKLSHLERLNLADNDFNFSHVPSLLGQLTKLTSLNLSYNNLAGELPFSLENLTKLAELDLSDNNFTSGGFSWLCKQTKLKYLLLRNVNLVGEIPFCLKNLTQLELLSLRQNNLKSQIPSWLSNLTQLTNLVLSYNELHGPIPESISQLVNLEILHLGPNYLSGQVRFEMFNRMAHLMSLQLSDNNNLTLLVDDSINDTLSKFEILGLNDCNLSKFPNFIRYQNHLSFLSLSDNNIEGHVPSWMGNVGKETLFILDLANNSIRGLEQPLTFSLLKNLLYLDVSNNMLQGPVPPVSLSIQHYVSHNNNLTGEISSWFCNLKYLTSLQLAFNNLRGKIPKCLGNSSDNLMILHLGSNHLNGNIPDTFKNESKLIVIRLSDNRLEGRLPRSLANCKMLQILDLGQNQISDTFPVWLGSLPMLEVVVLRSNYLFGALQTPHKISHFPKLGVLDLSKNELTSTIPYRFFKAFNNMKAFDLDQFAYMQGNVILRNNEDVMTVQITYTLNLANKGMYMKYGEIPNILAGLDLSSNKFEGQIPESIASLKMINILDFSNNQLSGQIPSFLRNLTKLESLDLSNNNFSGKIPQVLMELTFLEYFNVSNNQLTGSIPQGNQFGTFDNTSYQGNSGLCGFPLTNQCGNTKASPQPNNDGGSKLPIEVTWKSVAIGYGSGIVGGVVLGLVFYERHQNWVLHTFGRWRKRRPRNRGRLTICLLSKEENHNHQFASRNKKDMVNK